MPFYHLLPQILCTIMKRNICFICLIVILLSLVGCDGGGGGPTGPANAPIISNSRVRPNPAYPGATLVFEIDFVDVPGDLNGGRPSFWMIRAIIIRAWCPMQKAPQAPWSHRSL